KKRQGPRASRALAANASAPAPPVYQSEYTATRARSRGAASHNSPAPPNSRAKCGPMIGSGTRHSGTQACAKGTGSQPGVKGEKQIRILISGTGSVGPTPTPGGTLTR